MYMITPLAQYPHGVKGEEKMFHKRKLTEQEKFDKQAKLLRNLDQMDMLTQEIKDFAAEKKAEIQKLQSENLDNRKQLKEGYEGQNLDCWMMPNYETGNMQWIAKVGGELVFERPLLDDEKQLFINNGIAKVS